MRPSTFYFEYNIETGESQSKAIWGESILRPEDNRLNIYNKFNTMDTNGGYIEGNTYYGRAVALDVKTMGELVTTIVAIKE